MFSFIYGNFKSMKDVNAHFWHLFRLAELMFLRSLSTFFMRMRCMLRRVHVGNQCVFYGMMFIQRRNDARIEIGHGCQFRSTHFSNEIGIYHPCCITTLAPFAEICIGNNCGFSGVSIRAGKSIIIGNNVRCGANCLIMDSDGHMDDWRSGKPQPVIIGDNVWLGYNVTILKGVTIGENSLIGACSVVTKDIPANVVAVGNPCRVVRKI